MKDLIAALRPTLISLLVLTGLLGIAYPFVIGGIAAALFPDQARGSLVRDGAGEVRGSALLGQPFDDPAYFWGRPSAVAGGQATTSGSTNAGPSGFIGATGALGPNPALTGAVRARIRALRAADPGNADPVPVDLVTASASGLDPHITPAAASYQLRRIARARGVPAGRIRELVERHVEERTLGVLGERRVNVLRLNLALDASLVPRARGTPRP